MKQRNDWRDGILGESQLIPQIIYRLLCLYNGMSATWQQARVLVNHLTVIAVSRGAQKRLRKAHFISFHKQ